MRFQHLKKVSHIAATPAFLKNPKKIKALNDMVGLAYEMRALKLVQKYKWFDMVSSGEKKEEYREIKAHNISLLFDTKGASLTADEILTKLTANPKDKTIWKHLKKFYHVEFYRAYAKNRKKSIYKIVSIKIGKAKPQWSDNWQGACFVIKLGDKIV